MTTRAIWFHALPQSSFYWEEAYRLVAVQELMTEPTRPLVDYRADHYQGGPLVAILVARAIASVAGVGTTTLKLAALAFSSGTLVALYLLVRRFFGRSAALLATLAYLCGPPLVAFWGVCLMGFHSEALLPSLVLVYATLALATDAWRGAPAWFGTGALAALGIWFTPTAAFAVAACVSTWLLLRGLPPPRGVAWGAAGAGVGLSPWLAYNVTRDWAGLSRLAEVFAGSQRTEFRTQGLLERALELATRVPGEAFLDPGGDLAGTPWRPLLFAGALIPAGFGLLIGVLRMAPVLRRLRRSGEPPDPTRLEIVFWLYGLVFAVVYLASRFTLEVEPTPIAFRLMAPPAVFALVPIAISGSRVLRAGGWRRAIAATAVPLFLVSLATSTVAFALRYRGDGLPTTIEQGYLLMGHLALRKYPRSVERAVAEVRPVRDPSNREAALRGVAWGLVEDYEHGTSLEALRAGVADVAEPERSLVWQRVGGVARLHHGELERALERTGDPSFADAIERLDELLSLFATGPTGRRLAPEPALR